jgi:hypothetical protein
VRRPRLALILGAALAGCYADDAPPSTRPSVADDPPYVPPAASCTPASLDDPRAFPPCNQGGGIFGTWVVDEHGLPAYEYGLDQNRDARASFYNTEGLDRREHWAAFGNARVNALFYNDGYLELTTQDRGETILDVFDEAHGNFAGGFGWIDDGTETWCTAYKWRPAGSRTRRRFGMGWAEARLEHAGITVTRRLASPPGDATVVIADVTLENTGDAPRTLRHYEYWDVARRPIEINWVVSGMPFTTAPQTARDQRDARNGMFDEQVAWDPAEHLLGLRRSFAEGTSPPPPEQPSAVDFYPGDPFLVALTGDVADLYTDQAAFFGKGGVAAPDAVTARAAGQGTAGGAIGGVTTGLGQPRMFALRSDLTLAPGEQKTLRFAYGYAPMGEPFAIDPAWRDPKYDAPAAAADDLRPHLFYFSADRDPVLHRELAWHAAQMEVSTGRRDYWNVHVVPQGSAYLYLHGADGAARDISIFAVPLVYTHPELAKEELSLNMMITHAEDRRITYAFQGHGMLDDALGLHKDPSDVTIFLLWALSEYLGATGDLAFLDEKMPYYPIDALPGATVWDHLHDAVRYLFDVIGTGPHGLVRLSTGDWSDGIALEAKDHNLAVQKGESVPNTQMAIAVLPRVADLVEPRDPALAAEIRARVAALSAALPQAWTGSFFGRAYFGDDALAYATTINLEAQVWALIGGTFAKPEDRATLAEAVRAQLDEPSPAGATLLPAGQVWPAISGLLTWGYADGDGETAWKHLARNTMAAHAEAFPEVWYGIWSGPDGLFGPSGDRPGQTWFSQVTPMTDFPVLNNNQHAMPILAALRVAGIDATAAGIRVAPHVPGDFALQTALVDLSRRGSVIAGAYRPKGGGTRTVEVRAPSGTKVAAASVNGAPVAVTEGMPSVTLTVPATGGEARFQVDLE